MTTPTPAPGSLTVHLVRHGQTASYAQDAGLTELGRKQATDRGTALGTTVADGEHVTFGFAPTLRARETAELLRAALLEQTAERGIALTGTEIRVEPGYRNLQVWADGRPADPTQARQRATELAAAPGVPPGWVTEAARFWNTHETGDAMGFWLATPLLWHEPPASVVYRLIHTSVDRVVDGADRRLVIGSHSGCLRAMVMWAAGVDPGEPGNGEDVVLRVAAGSDVVSVAYADLEWEARVPAAPLDWSSDS
jgi:broad specificity phosphatase PhoE